MIMPQISATSSLIKELQNALVSTLGPLLTGTPSISLLDRPGHSNPGDTAIWLGSLNVCARLGFPRPTYACEQSTYSREVLGKNPGTILITGGGNIGDLWESHQLFRERVLADFPDRPIVQLPQSIHFCSMPNLKRAQDAFERHPRFTLLVRDRRSLEIAHNYFHVKTILCPDMSFGLGALRRTVKGSCPMFWLSRRDKESLEPEARSDFPGLQPCDYIAAKPTRLENFYIRLAAAVRSGYAPPSWVHRLLSSFYNRLGERRLERACRLLSSATTVVTNRLHGHILSLLLGIPHFINDNNYGKLRSFYETWTSKSPLGVWCESEAEALRQAMGNNMHPHAPETDASVTRYTERHK
jgi:pyruvyl transferase EpsO